MQPPVVRTSPVSRVSVPDFDDVAQADVAALLDTAIVTQREAALQFRFCGKTYLLAVRPLTIQEVPTDDDDRVAQ